MNKNKKNRKGKNSPQNIWKTLGGNLLIWVLIIIMAVTALQFFSTDFKPQTIDYTQFQDYIDQDMVESGRIIGRTFKGTFKDNISTSSKPLSKFSILVPPKDCITFLSALGA